MEFRSKLEEMTEAIELDFSPTPGFGPYKEVMPSEAVSHPAKANTLLLRFLIENFTSVGDTVLDPMAGSGSTGVVAALLGRNAVQVELERKFYEWMEKARENVERHVTLTPRGWIKNICGDARRLSELLSQTDVVLTSPP
jgi:DNA modification methylase